MKLALRMSLSSGSSASSPYAAYAFAFVPTTSNYWVGGTKYAAVTSLPGYTFTRTGEQGAVDSTGAVSYFAANVPAINDQGYHAYGALTNEIPNSQAFGSGWGALGGTSVTSNTSVAPDGTATADTVTFTANAGDRLFQGTATLGGNSTMSIWAKTASGTKKFSIASYNGGTENRSADFTATTSWQRFTFYNTQVAPSQVSLYNGSDAVAGDLIIWQAQWTLGNFPDGGPIIRTAGATASVGASALAVSLANSTYDATYTFDDDSTQNNAALAIADGALNLPTDFTPNRNIIKELLIS